MTDRIGYDCIGGNAQWVRDHLPLPSVMFWYGTGSPAIEWSAAERAMFPSDILVEIDQGGMGTPVLTAMVRDVENGAWQPGQAANKTGWHVTRPTIYCNRSTLPSVAADGWKGDVWLAWPGWTGEALPEHPGITIIGVQDQFNGGYDHTTFIDPTWPALPNPVPAGNSMSITVDSRNANMAYTVDFIPDMVQILFAPQAGARFVVLRTITGVHPGVANHVSNLTIPGHAGGIISVAAIKNGVATEIGVRAL